MTFNPSRRKFVYVVALFRLAAGAQAWNPAAPTPNLNDARLQEWVRATGKPVVWIGKELPAGTDETPKVAALQQLAAWGAGVVETPEAVVVRMPGAFRSIGTVGNPNDKPEEVVSAALPLLLCRLPSASLKQMASPNGLTLTQAEAASPGLSRPLREMLLSVRTRNTDPDLSEAPAGRLRLRLRGSIEASLFVNRANGTALLDKEPPPFEIKPLAPAAPVWVWRGTLAQLLESGIATPQEASPLQRRIVDVRLANVPVALALPLPVPRDLWPLLSQTLGVERRTLGNDVVFFAPQMEAHTYESHRIAALISEDTLRSPLERFIPSWTLLSLHAEEAPHVREEHDEHDHSHNNGPVLTPPERTLLQKAVRAASFGPPVFDGSDDLSALQKEDVATNANLRLRRVVEITITWEKENGKNETAAIRGW